MNKLEEHDLPLQMERFFKDKLERTPRINHQGPHMDRCIGQQNTIKAKSETKIGFQL